MNKIKGCKIYGHVCQYKCCNHDTGSSYYIWMYPGEYENSLKRKNHIEISRWLANKAVIWLRR